MQFKPDFRMEVVQEKIERVQEQVVLLADGSKGLFARKTGKLVDR